MSIDFSSMSVTAENRIRTLRRDAELARSTRQTWVLTRSEHTERDALESFQRKGH